MQGNEEEALALVWLEHPLEAAAVIGTQVMEWKSKAR
jgi:hypothetical protein